MALVTNIANLSQTPSLNGPDGSVDPPSTLDDQDRYLGSFIAMLRDGVGFTAGAPIVALGFTPVRQGGNSSGTTTNTISVGWNGGLGKLVCAVDNNQFSNKWPIDTTGDAGSVNGQVFSWSNPSNSPTYVWGANANGSAFLAAPAGMSVNYANSAGSAPANGGTSAACSGNAATATTANNSNQVGGIALQWRDPGGGSPSYVMCGNSPGDSFVRPPSALSVGYATNAGNANYANSAGSAPANGGTASSANALGGGNVSQLNVSGSNFIGVVGGTQYWWPVNVLSDERLKTDIVPSSVDSIADIMRMRFVGYRFKKGHGFDTAFHGVGILAQEAELIESNWIGNAGEWKQPNTYEMLMSTMHAVQQLNAKVVKLAQLITGGS